MIGIVRRATDPIQSDRATKKLDQFLDYCATHPDEKVRYIASVMILVLYSDASHLSEPGSKRRAAGHWYAAV